LLLATMFRVSSSPNERKFETENETSMTFPLECTEPDSPTSQLSVKKSRKERRKMAAAGILLPFREIISNMPGLLPQYRITIRPPTAGAIYAAFDLA
jgi:hypothetical protein